ncbi:unnamed protein product [Arctia plantaginis]|uniref:Uncharacterized protein n=1 Tax=Arctia plantaginis TaxID=874455 RepID=A0A8S1BM56_ARCPL|nr:unnamed protein product [Arctia plantaginis]CAB3261375.1 unnamed protein product [Arctia plantaginis]
MSSKTDKEKSISIVFQRKPLLNSIKVQSERKYKHQGKHRLLTNASRGSNETMRTTFAAWRPDISRSNDLTNLKFSHLVKAVQIASEEEKTNTDKFITDVETMVTRFSNEFKKFQSVIENIIEKYPQLQLNGN